jgi:orotidine-5'-phosphate decarboxylase
MHFADALTARIAASSPLCVSLDPLLEKLPEGIPHTAEGIFAFNKGLVDALQGIAAAAKLQLAHYERLGWEGMKVFWETCEYAKRAGMIVIADAKRGDIGNAGEAYAEAYLYEGSPVDALTVNPYLGSDGVTPFIERCVKNGKGIYVVVKTSNASSGELQDLPVGDEVVHEHLAQLVESWGMHHIGPETNLSCVGAVVGATYPEEMKYLRTLMPHIPFLIPGYGAQGGTAEDAAHGFHADGTGALVAAGSGVIFASSGKDWADAAVKAARETVSELRKAL